MKTAKHILWSLAAAVSVSHGASAQSEWTEESLTEALAGPKTRSLAACERGEKLNLTSAELAAARKAILSIQFELGSAVVKPNGVVKLLGKSLNNERLQCHDFLLAGHTDAVGSEAYNLELSQARAQAVRAYLSDNFSVDGTRLDTQGFGEAALKNKEDPNADENRRVEVIILTGKN